MAMPQHPPLKIPEVRDNLLINRNFKDINPLICGEHYCPHSHGFGPAVRPYYLLHYVFEGKGSFTVFNDNKDNAQVYEVSQGQIFVIKPEVKTYYEADAKNPWHYVWIGFESAMDLEFIFYKPVLDCARGRNIFKDMIDCERTNNAKELFIYSKILELLSVLSEQNVMPQENTPDYVLKAINYIESNYVKQISVTQIAESLNLDRSYFSISFRKVTGKSPQQYIVDYRMKKAVELMEKGLRPGEAAQMVGYPDVFNFSRMFKRKYGVSPSMYTRSHKDLP